MTNINRGKGESFILNLFTIYLDSVIDTYGNRDGQFGGELFLCLSE